MPAPHGGMPRRRGRPRRALGSFPAMRTRRRSHPPPSGSDHRKRELQGIGITATPEVALADAGYWHQAQMEAVVDRGSRSSSHLTPATAGATRPGWDGGLYAFVRRVLATDRGGGLYAKHQGMIEPVFADARFNRRCDRFQRRGRSAVRSEWRLIGATHNLLKLRRLTMAPRPPARGGPARAAHPTKRSRCSATASARSGSSAAGRKSSSRAARSGAGPPLPNRRLLKSARYESSQGPTAAWASV